jgi:carbon monoxide dehydrogenase subunit G
MTIRGAAILLVLLGVAAPSFSHDGAWAVVAQTSGTYRVEGGFEVEASSAAVWAVLTDYDRIDEFVSSLRESRVVERGLGEVLVDQEALAGFLVFGREVRVRLRVKELPRERIVFEDTLRRDFAAYAGSWRIAQEGEKVRVDYELAVRPAFRVPGFLTRRALQRTTRELLDDVRREIQD